MGYRERCREPAPTVRITWLVCPRIAYSISQFGASRAVELFLAVPHNSSHTVEHIEESEERYLAPVAVYSCDVSGVIRDDNSRAAELWGRNLKLGIQTNASAAHSGSTARTAVMCPMSSVRWAMS